MENEVLNYLKTLKADYLNTQNYESLLFMELNDDANSPKKKDSI
jgi:hypothetical protein